MDNLVDQIKIAKINAWQAIIVALIGGIAGVTGTIGVKYFNYTTVILEKDKELKRLEKKIVQYEQDLAGSPLVVLRLVKLGIDTRECLERLSKWHGIEISKWKGSGFSSQETSYDGNFISQFGHFTVRVACSKTHDMAAVSVSFLHQQDEDMGITQGVELADRVIAVLQ